VNWSRSLPARFKALFGYEIYKFLPLLVFRQNNLAQQNASPGSFQCVLDTEDEGIGYVNDFRGALSHGYNEYLSSLTEWSNSLGMQFSAQPGYNLPVDMKASIPFVDAPECESLGFGNSIDMYRQFTGAAYLSGKEVISNELGAEVFEAFRYELWRLLWSANRGFAAGINQYVIHGQTFSGPYYETTWPGYVPFEYLFSELYSDKQPSWEMGMQDILDYMGRTQRTLQMGTAQTDIAIYDKNTEFSPDLIYEDEYLQNNGTLRTVGH